MKAGVVVPTYKESENIGALVSELRRVVPGVALVIVDDTPDDSTVDALTPVSGPDLSVIHRETKDGRGSAALTGLRQLLAGGCDVIVEMDADFSHSPAELPALLDSLGSIGCDMLIASRYLPGSRIERWPLSRRMFSRAANLLARTLLRVPVRDYTNGYRVYTRNAAQVVSDTCGRLGRGFIPLSEILVNLHYRGFRVAEVPSVFVNRARGESSVSRSEVWNALTGLFRIYGLKRRLAAAQVASRRTA
jgi:dolichol-phosphate mannosyltransferase